MGNINSFEHLTKMHKNLYKRYNAKSGMELKEE